MSKHLPDPSCEVCKGTGYVVALSRACDCTVYGTVLAGQVRRLGQQLREQMWQDIKAATTSKGPGNE